MRGRLKAGWTVVLLLSVLFLSSTLAIQSNQEESESSNEGNPISSPPRGIVPAYEQLLSDWVSGYPPLAQLTVTAHDAIFYGTTGGGSVLFEIGANFDVNTTDTSLYIYNAQAYCKVQEQLFTGPNTYPESCQIHRCRWPLYDRTLILLQKRYPAQQGL